MHPLLNTAIKAARRAGSIITRASEDISSLTITSKNMNDFVSEVDLASEKEIIYCAEAKGRNYPCGCL